MNHTLPESKHNIAPENRPSQPQKESNDCIPQNTCLKGNLAIRFQGV